MKQLTTLLAKTEGFKTYLIVVVMIAYVLIGVYLDKGLDTQLLLEALAIAGLRRAIK